ncbi:sugar phosphate isomerase/epimerase, partial [Synergistaceae bacterium OttesenSCG-928-I11]|nr:sugar phosphate isomerase/epimerase [Synergistaceae bacterium OttesenSCG-928-I11]
NLPSEAEVENLKNISREKEISISVHLPASIELGDPDSAIRRLSADLFKRTVDLTAPLDPSFWVFHVTGAPAFASMRATDFGALEACKARIYETLSPLMNLFDDSRKLAIENVLPHFYIEPEFVSAFDTSVCIDIGHLLCHRQDIDEHLARWIRRCRSVHLHGVEANGVDHQSLRCIPRPLLSHILKKLHRSGFDGTLTLEIFEREDFERSIEALEAVYLEN